MIKRFALLLSALLSLGLHAQAQTYPSPTVQNFTVLGTMTASGLATSGTIANSLCQTSAGTVLSVAGVNCFGGGGGSLTLTDGTHTVTPTTQITVTGGTVGGSTPNATLTITGGSGITQLTGDILAGPGSGSVSATLPTVNSNVGTFASETVNAKGQVTAAGNLTGDVTTSGAASTLATVNSNVGSFTNANITVNGKGLITAAANGSGGSGFAGYAGTTAGTANAQTIASPSPSGWTNTDQNQIFFKVGAGLTNTTAAPTLAISSQTAEPMDVQTGAALVSLPAGYLVAGLQYSATYQSGCTCYVVTTTPNSGVTIATTSQAPTSALWAIGQVYNLNAASLTVTPVVSTTLSPGGSVVVNAINAGTLAATSPDTITTSAGTTGAGGNIALAAGTVTVVTTDGAGHLYAAGNTGGSSGITTLTGDVTAGPGSGSQAATLATVNSNVGTFASETVNGKGLVTAASALSGDLTTSGAVTTFATVNSNVGSFTNANITVNGKGLITAAANGTAGTPVIFVGAGAGTANAQTVATTTPSGFTLTNQFVVRFSAGATNTAAATLNVNSTGATAVDKQLSSGFAALSGGEIVSGLEYDATYNSTCTCFVLTNTPGSAIVNNATSATVTAVQWANGTLFNVTSAAQTITLPVATTLASNGNIFINAIGNSVTLAPNAADGINGGSTGASVTVASGVFAVVSTVGSSGTGAITANPLTGGGGLPTIANGHIIANATGSSAAAQDTSLAAGTGISLAASGGTITITNTSGGGGATITPPQGRLTLTSHTPILAADVTGATTLYYDSWAGGTYPNFDGTVDQTITIAANEVSDVLGTTAPAGVLINQVVDEWGLASGVICHATDGSGHGWSSDTGGSNVARGTGYSQLDNTTRYYVTNKNALANCYNGATNEGSIAANKATYLGTFWTLEAAGAINMQFHVAFAAGGTAPCLCLFNGSNRVVAHSIVGDTNSWNGNNAASWGPADVGGAGSGLRNRVSWVDGKGVTQVSALANMTITPAVGNNGGEVGVDYDSASATPRTISYVGGTNNLVVSARDNNAGLLGGHFAQLMEWTNQTGTINQFTNSSYLEFDGEM